MHRLEEGAEPAAHAVECPCCGLPARIIDRFTLRIALGPVEHVKLACRAGHWFTPPVESLLVGKIEPYAVQMASASAAFN